MNTGMKTIEWLFSEQLQVDDKWSVRTPNGFRWWADRNEQTVEVVGQETGPDKEIDYLVSVRTELLRCLHLGDRELKGMNALLMAFASMAGPVYDQEAKTPLLAVRVLRDALLLFGEISLEKPKNRMNKCPIGFWHNAGRCMKRHENALRIGTFWHQLGGRSLPFRSKARRLSGSEWRLPPQTEPRDTEALISNSALQIRSGDTWLHLAAFAGVESPRCRCAGRRDRLA
jgi:hypothetical protein